MELNHLRRMKLNGTTHSCLFFQLKYIFHLLESIGSARIEGNRTTISEYIEEKIEGSTEKSDNLLEISNVEKAISFIEEGIDEGSDITHHFLKELHTIAVSGLDREGDRTPGAYRTWNVGISNSDHSPPDSVSVQGYMDELIDFINKNHGNQFDLIKTALAHHRFVWIHPFGNGNGRVVRLLTYSLLIKYGFNVKEKLINPTAVFCNDRDKYYSELAKGDTGTEEALLDWCQYVLDGILVEVEKINKLLEHDYLYENILLPTVQLGAERKYVTPEELAVLKVAIVKQEFKAADVEGLGLSSRQKTHLLQKMKVGKLIRPLKEGGRTYHINFTNNYLMRGLIEILEKEGFIPSIY